MILFDYGHSSPLPTAVKEQETDRHQQEWKKETGYSKGPSTYHSTYTKTIVVVLRSHIFDLGEVTVLRHFWEESIRPLLCFSFKGSWCAFYYLHSPTIFLHFHNISFLDDPLTSESSHYLKNFQLSIPRIRKMRRMDKSFLFFCTALRTSSVDVIECLLIAKNSTQQPGPEKFHGGPNHMLSFSYFHFSLTL